MNKSLGIFVRTHTHRNLGLHMRKAQVGESGQNKQSTPLPLRESFSCQVLGSLARVDGVCVLFSSNQIYNPGMRGLRVLTHFCKRHYIALSGTFDSPGVMFSRCTSQSRNSVMSISGVQLCKLSMSAAQAEIRHCTYMRTSL
jgi:hypothetical protein